MNEALAALSLLAFGWRAGGYPLHRWAVYGYAVVTALALLWNARALLRSTRREGREALEWHLTLPPLLALWVAGLYASTEVLGAKFSPYIDDTLEIFAALNLLFALTGCALALLYRWPHLLLVWAGGQGLLLLTHPGLIRTMLRWGMPGLVGWIMLGLPLAYGFTALALGWRPARRPFLLGLLGAAAVGLALAIRPTLRLMAEATRDLGTGLEVWTLVVLSGPGTAAYWAFVALLPLHVGIAWRGWSAADREHRAEPKEVQRPSPWVWATFALLLLAAASFAAPWLQPSPAGHLPAAGEVQRWRSADHIVPADAWLPTVTWVGWLLAAVRWSLLPCALLGLANALRQTRPRLRRLTFPRTTLWTGLGWLALFAWDLSPLGFPLRLAWETYSVLGAFFLPLLGGVALLVAARVWERHWTGGGPRSGGW